MNILYIAIAGLLVALGIQTVRLHDEQADHSHTIATVATERQKATDTLLAKEREYRAKERTLQEKANDTIKTAKQELARASVALADTRTAGQRLRDELAAARARQCAPAGGDPGTGPGSPSADTTSDLLAVVQRRLDEATEGIAGFADAAHIAGKACERQYDAVR